MFQLQKVGRSGAELAEVYTLYYARFNEEEDHMGGACGKNEREKEFAQNFRQKS